LKTRQRVTVENLSARAYTIPTDAPEADGTLEWTSTTLVIAEVSAGGVSGIGYTYADAVAATLIESVLRDEVVGRSAWDIGSTWQSMCRSVRNLGRPGIASHAISAVDTALWDLKSKLLGLPLIDLLGKSRPSIPVYGSGGFTSYSIHRLQKQLSEWVSIGIPRVKMKVGATPSQDVARVRAAREVIGDAELFVDANGAYTQKEALSLAEEFDRYDVKWFEEPVSSDDLDGLRFIREHAPIGMAIAAGEYGYDLRYYLSMLRSHSVDVLQADATRCTGVTGFMKTAALCEAWSIPLSAHTSPTLHAHLCCAAQTAVHVEYFHDHVRIERMFFDGVLDPKDGRLTPSHARPGLGIELRESDLKQFAA